MSLRTWRSFARFFDDSKGLLAWTVVLSVGQAVAFLPLAYLVKRVFDTLIPQQRTGALIVSGLLILSLYLLSAGLSLLTRYLVLRTTKAGILRLRVRLIERVFSLPRAYFDRSEAGILHSTIVQDSERLNQLSTTLLGDLAPALIITVGLVSVLLALNALLFAVLAAVVPILIVFGRWLGGRVRTTTRKWYEDFDVFSKETQIAIRSITLTKVEGAEQPELERRSAQLRDFAESGQRASWYQSAYTIVQQSVAASAGAVVLVVGGVAVAHGSMSLGSLISFYALVALLLRQVYPILGSLPRITAGEEAISRLDQILAAEEEEPYRGTRKLDFQGSLSIEALDFGYGGEPLLQGVSLEVERGERAAIIGPNGAGKTTLMSLILGLYRPQGGRLLADGVPYDELDIRALRRSMGVVLQEAIIFPGTILDNIKYGNPDASDEEVAIAAEWATAAEFIERFPLGYATQVGDDGELLSGGQRQRIALARALMARPSLLILDEPTTHLDDASIAQLLTNLLALPGSPSVLLISHDMEVAREADVIYRLRDGQIADVDGASLDRVG
ncbi:MAG TPA: ABC transporter ATP-binding protein [Thermoleophilaceae bacterium]|nr:ABC transporter ATP-binding protein [Thermoleophilaceae bacterium]